MKAEVVCIFRLGWKGAFWEEEQCLGTQARNGLATWRSSGQLEVGLDRQRAIHGTEVSSPEVMSLNFNFIPKGSPDNEAKSLQSSTRETRNSAW